MWKVEYPLAAELATIHKLLAPSWDSRGYRRGFLAGFFDAEGHNGSSLRISQVDVEVLRRVQRMAASLGFDFMLEAQSATSEHAPPRGTIADRIRFFSICQPAILRRGRPSSVSSRRPHGIRVRRGAGTVTRSRGHPDFLQNLLRCRPRHPQLLRAPTHEYLGFSAGLDFETRILVKERGAELLRQRLAAKSWKPQVVALSGVDRPVPAAERRSS